jgi:hypothetical protein
MKVVKYIKQDEFIHEENKRIETIINNLNDLNKIYELVVQGPDEVKFEFHDRNCTLVEFRKENNPDISDKDNIEYQEKYSEREKYEKEYFNGGGGYSMSIFPWCLDGIFLVWDSSKKNPKRGRLFNLDYIVKAIKITTAEDVINSIALFLKEERDAKEKIFIEKYNDILGLLKKEEKC